MRSSIIMGMVCVFAGIGCATVDFDERSTGGSDPASTSSETETPGSGTTEDDTGTGSGTSSSSVPSTEDTTQTSGSVSDTGTQSATQVDTQTHQTDSETSTACKPACAGGNYCDEGDCQPCVENDHCGSSCAACPSDQPVCDGATAAAAQCVCQLGDCDAGDFCDGVTFGCEPCLVDDHCGPTCDACGGDTPECIVTTPGDPMSAGCGCAATDECDLGKWCDTTAGHGTCATCGSGAANNAHCGAACTNCAVAGGSCDAEGKCSCAVPEDCNDGSTCVDLSCTVCDQDEFCGLACNDCTQDTDTPYCQGAMCVECTTNDHCLPPAFCHQGTGTCVNCQGTTVGGHCWYFGEENLSCGEVCASHGGYNAGTLTYAGSDGTSEQCQEVLDVLRSATTSMLATPPFTEAVGCGFWPGASMGLRVTTAATTDTATNSLVRRACACNN